MMDYKSLAIREDGLVTIITLLAPPEDRDKLVWLSAELLECCKGLRENAEARAIVLTGESAEAFCAGADLSEFLTAPVPTEARKARFERDLWGLFLSISQLLTAAVHSYALGSGIEIALCCDIRIASYDPCAVRKAKEAVVRGIELPLSQALELEKRLALEVVAAKSR